MFVNDGPILPIMHWMSDLFYLKCTLVYDLDANQSRNGTSVIKYSIFIGSTRLMAKI